MWRWFARRDRRPDPEAYPAGPVRNLAAASPPPFRTPVSEVEFLAVDLETTGLDLRRDHVLAVGWLPVTARQVVLAGARRCWSGCRRGSRRRVGDRAPAHRRRGGDGPHLGDALPDLLAALEARVLLAHHAPIELGFLKRAAREAYGAGCRSPRSTPWRCTPARARPARRDQPRLAASQRGASALRATALPRPSCPDRRSRHWRAAAGSGRRAGAPARPRAGVADLSPTRRR